MHELPALAVARTYSMGLHVANDALDRLMVIPGSGILGAPLYPQLMQLPLYSHLLSLLGLQSRFQLLHTGHYALSGQARSRQAIGLQSPIIAPDLTCEAPHDCRLASRLKPRELQCHCGYLWCIVCLSMRQCTTCKLRLPRAMQEGLPTKGLRHLAEGRGRTSMRASNSAVLLLARYAAFSASTFRTSSRSFRPSLSQSRFSILYLTSRSAQALGALKCLLKTVLLRCYTSRARASFSCKTSSVSSAAKPVKVL